MRLGDCRGWPPPAVGRAGSSAPRSDPWWSWIRPSFRVRPEQMKGSESRMQGKVMTDDAKPTVYVGIDVCKAHLDIYLFPLDQELRVANDACGRRQLLRLLLEHQVERVVMEPTSKYHRATHRHLHANGIAVALVNPLRARLFAKAIGQLAKTDRIDARLLALVAERLQPGQVRPPSVEEEALEELAGARTAALAERVAISNRLGTTETAFLRRELARRLRNLDAHVERLEAQIGAMM